MEIPTATKKPFPALGTHAEQLAWVSTECKVCATFNSYNGSLRVKPEDFEGFLVWMYRNYGRTPTSRVVKAQREFSFGAKIIAWFATEMRSNNVLFIGTRFGVSLNKSFERLEEYKAESKVQRERLYQLIGEKQGRQGCFTCGETEKTLFFTRQDGSGGRGGAAAVSTLLVARKWQQAETEAMKSILLCVKCNGKDPGLLHHTAKKSRKEDE